MAESLTQKFRTEKACDRLHKRQNRTFVQQDDEAMVCRACMCVCVFVLCVVDHWMYDMRTVNVHKSLLIVAMTTCYKKMKSICASPCDRCG